MCFGEVRICALFLLLCDAEVESCLVQEVMLGRVGKGKLAHGCSYRHLAIYIVETERHHINQEYNKSVSGWVRSHLRPSPQNSTNFTRAVYVSLKRLCSAKEN